MRTLRFVALLGTFAFLAFSSDTGSPAVTPEPNLVVVLATGLAGIGALAWRRNRKK